MLEKIYIGQKVRILDNAYPGSPDPDDILLRGKEGEVVAFFPDGEVYVKVGETIAYLVDVELEEIK